MAKYSKEFKLKGTPAFQGKLWTILPPIWGRFKAF